MLRFNITPANLTQVISNRFISSGIASDKIKELIGAIDKKQKSAVGLTDLEKAQEYWQNELFGQSLIITPQSRNCKIAILIPVYNETLDRLKKQLKSIEDQEGIETSEFEVIYLINNKQQGTDPQNEKAILANKIIMEELEAVSYKQPNIFFIDKSTPGNEFKECSVGRARNRLTAEASLRFFKNGRNGILIHTDADTFMEDKVYLTKVLKVFEDEPFAVGVAGGIIYEFAPDEQDGSKIPDLKSKAKKIVLYRKWNAVSGLINNVDHFRYKWYKTFFTGNHMISKSFESAVIGGIWKGNIYEDNVFGFELEAYASQNKKKVIEATDTLQLITALRESDRTDASLSTEFKEMNVNAPIYLQNPLSPNKSYVLLTQENYERLVKHVLKTHPVDGKELIEHINLTTDRI